jgi:acyl-CoA thioesterase I
MKTKIQNQQTFLFIGDSITDCGRREANSAPHGCGYVSYLRDMLLTREPEKKIKIINTGIGGNTIEDLRSRWIDDVLAHQPDWLSIKIGINDCNRFTTNPKDNQLQSPEEFHRIYNELLLFTKSQIPKINLLLVDPFFASNDKTNQLPGSYRQKVHCNLSAYIKTVEEMSKKFGTLHLKTQELFQNIFKLQPASTFFPHEPVHPNQSGHMFIAENLYAILSA